MRMIITISLPHEEFNQTVKDGTVGKKLKKILAEAKAEAVYFTERDGERAVIMVVMVEDPSKIPFFAEPWFLTFNADVKFSIAMTPEDLGRAGLDELGKKWG
ncbi:MAG: panthothenate synthetase [Deltaproteobacteria bacterium]|jgi:hypothetical protein